MNKRKNVTQQIRSFVELMFKIFCVDIFLPLQKIIAAMSPKLFGFTLIVLLFVAYLLGTFAAKHEQQ